MRKYIGFSVLMFFALVLFVSTLINLWRIHLVLFLLFWPIIAFALYRIFMHGNEVKNKIKASYTIKSKQAFFDFIYTFAGAYLTYLLSVQLGLGGVLASGMIGILAVLVVKPYAVPVFCGSFLGMSSAELIDPVLFVFASLVASSLFVLAKDVFNGFGGKLGTIALSSALVTVVFVQQPFLDGPVFDDLDMVLIMVFSMIGAVLTFILNIRFKQGPVMASAVVGVLAGVILPQAFDAIGPTLAIVTFGASFVGMSGLNRLKEESLVLLAGLFFGLIYIYSAPYFGGAGGKLGTIAFVSVLSVSGLHLFISQHIFKQS